MGQSIAAQTLEKSVLKFDVYLITHIEKLLDRLCMTYFYHTLNLPKVYKQTSESEILEVDKTHSKQLNGWKYNICPFMHFHTGCQPITGHNRPHTTDLLCKSA